MKRIFYLGYYDVPDGKTSVAPAATVKMSYIIKTLAKMGYSVEIVSASVNEAGGKHVGETRKIGENVSLTTFDSNLGKNKILRAVRRQKHFHQLRKYLKNHVSAGDAILLYHSLGYYKLYKWLQKHRKAKVILEVEEIYCDVGKTRLASRRKELRSFDYANAYIFPTQLLDDEINAQKKPSVIIHGTYCAEEKCGQVFRDGKIRVVYAGTLDPRKGGAQAAAAARFLPKGYHVHILGFGSEIDKQNLLKTIDEVSEKAECTITYDGVKRGAEYIRFIQSCDIGLSTQNPDAAFNATSFPSKILSYMANGLRVVSIRIPTIEQSAIGDYMYYYDEQTPEKIAEAIKRVDLNDGYDSRKIIGTLDEKFTREMNELLKTI